MHCYEAQRNKRLSEAKKRHKRGAISDKLNYQYLIEEYAKKKRSLEDIAKDCDCTRQFVFKKLKEFKISLRAKGESRRLAFERQKISFTRIDEGGNARLLTPVNRDVNDKFFELWSNGMAYVLGVVFTDGNLYRDSRRKTFRFGVSQKDPELLYKVLKLMDSNAILIHTRQRGISGELYRFDINNHKMYFDLVKLGLSPDKSNVMNFPMVPEQYVRHFIRGCWDGDGSIYIEGKTGTIRASYVSGSLKFIQRLVEELYKVGIYKIRPPSDKNTAYKMRLKYPDGKYPLTIHMHNRTQAYYIRINGTENLTRLFGFFYDGVDDSMYLKRKFDTFAKGLSIITEGLEENLEDVDGT